MNGFDTVMLSISFVIPLVVVLYLAFRYWNVRKTFFLGYAWEKHSHIILTSFFVIVVASIGTYYFIFVDVGFGLLVILVDIPIFLILSFVCKHMEENKL